MDHVWRYDFGGTPNIVETYIGFVRKKINAAGPPLIQTIRLVSYTDSPPYGWPISSSSLTREALRSSEATKN